MCQCRPEEGDVRDGEAERVDLGEALLVGEGRHVQPQLLERRVDARRAVQHMGKSVLCDLFECDAC